MNKARLVGIIVVVLLAGLIFGALASASPPASGVQNMDPDAVDAALGTAFTYQGRLEDGGVPADGEYDFHFTLYDALNGGAKVGATINVDNVAVSDGLFTVSLNFGQPFTGKAFWCVLAAMAVNTGSSALEVGDIVDLRGSHADAALGQPLVMEVGQAQAGAALVGVVYGRGELVEVLGAEGQMVMQVVPREGAAQPGDFVHIVINGPAQVKASAVGQTIALGQKLAVNESGTARLLKSVEVEGVQLAESAPTIGIALEAMDAGKDGLIWVMVNPQ